jgi:hypothetical protein
MTIVDSCVVLDIAQTGPFFQASFDALSRQTKRGRLFAPDIVFAEVSAAYSTVSDAQNLFKDLRIDVIPLTPAALFRAAHAFKAFKRANKSHWASQSQSEKRILPDFYVGSLADVEGLPLLTRDKRRKWESLFPGISVIYP